jgi:hypothetical protein
VRDEDSEVGRVLRGTRLRGELPSRPPVTLRGLQPVHCGPQVLDAQVRSQIRDGHRVKCSSTPGAGGQQVGESALRGRSSFAKGILAAGWSAATSGPRSRPASLRAAQLPWTSVARQAQSQASRPRQSGVSLILPIGVVQGQAQGEHDVPLARLRPGRRREPRAGARFRTLLSTEFHRGRLALPPSRST